MTNPFGSPTEDDDFEIDGLDKIDSKFRIPEGKYKLRLIDLEKGESKAGNPMWVFTFMVIGGEHEGHELKCFCALTPAAMWKLNETLEALKLPAVDGRAKFKKNDAIGRECMAEIEDNEYQGRVSSAISTLAPL